MKKLFFAPLFLAVLTVCGHAQDKTPFLKAPKAMAGPKVEGLELSPDMEITTKQRAVMIEAATKGKTVKWIVFNARAEAPVTYMEVPLAKSILIFPNDQEDVIFVLAYTSIGDLPTDPAKTTITVRGPPPKPKPKDEDEPDVKPDPLPPGVKIHVTMVFDHEKMTPKLAALENSKTLRDVLRTQGHKLHVLDVKQKVIDDADLRKYLAAHGPFTLIVQRDDGPVLWAGPLPDTDKAVLDRVTKTIGGK